MKRNKRQKRNKPEVVTVGNVVVKIYPHRKKIPGQKKPYVTWQVADYTTGERRWQTFRDHDKAVELAKRLAGQIAAGESVAAQMKATEAASYGRAMELLRPIGDSLELAAARYAEAVKILGDGSRLVNAVKDFVERDHLPKKTLQEVIDLMLKDKTGKREERTIDDLRNRLAKFSESFQGPISTITKADVQGWLDKLKTSERDKLNYRSKLNTLFRWAWRRNYILSNPVEKTERPEAGDGDIQIYTPAELERLIAAASKEFLPCLLLGAFAGLRSSEITRLNWEDINLSRGHIVASGKKKGTPSRRLVPIQPNLAAWLGDYTKSKGLVWKDTGDHFSDAQQETAARTEIEADPKNKIEAQKPVEWKHNGLRHSFISYRLAAIQDDAKTALEAGNSADTIHAHYKELVTPDEAKVWFAIAPERPANLVTLKSAASSATA